MRVLGRLGHYVTQSGFGITPIVGLVSLPFRVRPRPGEVDEIVEIPLHHALDASRYALHQHPGSIRAHYHLFWEEVVLGGPTVAVLMGLYEELFRGKATR